MKKYFFPLLVFLILCGVSSAFAGEYERIYEQWYAVNSEADLSIDNRYGDIVLNTWEKSEVKIIVTITCETNRQDKADRFFEEIEIRFDGDRSFVKAETKLGFRKSKVKNFSIDYSIFAPASMNFLMKNKFGDIYLPDLGGPLNLDLSYGEFSIGRLLNDDNYLDISYSEGQIVAIAGGSFESGYSEVEVLEIGQIRLDSDFSDFSVQNAEILDVETSYDEITFGKIDMLTIESKFSEVDIEELKVGMKGNFSYGELTLERTLESVEDVFVSGKFCDMRFALNSAVTWKFLAKTEYTEMGFSDPVGSIDESEENYYEKIYSGVLWQKNPPSSIFTLEAKNCDIDIVKF